MKKKFKKTLSFLLISALIFINLSTFSFAEQENNSEVKSFDFSVENNGGLIDKKITDSTYNENQNNLNISSTASKRVFGTSDLPSKYDLRDYNLVTDVKNQGNGETCWAFSIMSAVESNCIKNGISKLSDCDFSEDHLVWFTNKMSDELKDGVTFDKDDSPYNIGGTWQDAVVTLVNWWGVEKEANAKYNSDDMSKNGNYSESQRTVSYAHLQNANLIGNDYIEINQKRNIIKNEIINKGSCIINYYSNEDNLYLGSYYQCSEKSSNHSVAIVGWDDSYSKSKFKSATGAKPKYNGAWLVKNDWGKSYGNGGYIWISYFDTSLSGAVVFEMEETDNYDNVYSYNGCAPAGIEYLDKTENLKYANTFTANSDEILDAVGIWTLQNNVSYTINIYKNLSSTATSPEDGTPVASAKTTGTIDYQGYHTIKLNDRVTVSEGEKYSVVIYISEKDASYLLLPFEGDGYDFSLGNNKKISIDYNSNSGESYIYNSAQWYDTKSFENGKLNNALINAYTYRNNDYGVKFSSDSVDVIAGERIAIEVTAVPSTAKICYASDSAANNLSVSFDDNVLTVKGEKIGSEKITAYIVVNDRKYEASVVVNVKENDHVLTNLHIEDLPDKLIYSVGSDFEKKGLKVSGIYSNGNEADVTDGCVFSGFSSKSVGEKTVTVSYEEYGVKKTAEFSVLIVNNSCKQTIDVENRSCVSGRKFAVPILLYTDKTSTSVSVEVTYNTELFKYEGAENGNVFVLFEKFNAEEKNGVINITVKNALPTGKNGVVAVIYFSTGEKIDDLTKATIAVSATSDGSDINCINSEILINSAYHKHDDGVWYVKRRPTYFTDGIKERKCGDCGEILETVNLPKKVLNAPKSANAVTLSTSSIKISYSKVSDATGYHIFNRTTKKIYATTANTFTISSLSAGTKNELYVRAFVSGGGKTANGIWLCVGTFATKPGTVVLSAVTAGKNYLIASYKKVSGADGYQILYSTSSNFSKYQYVNTTNLKKTITKLSSGKVYYAKVRAYIKINKTVTWGQFSTVKSVKIK